MTNLCYEGPGNTCAVHHQLLIKKRIHSEINGHPAMVWWVCPETETPIKVATESD
jgi:hypothetical protein